MIPDKYEQFKPVRQIWTWLVIIFLAVTTLSWAMATHMAVPDVPRHWDFDVLPDTPGSSPYSTLPPPDVSPVPPQIELPPDYLDRTSATAVDPNGERG